MNSEREKVDGHNLHCMKNLRIWSFFGPYFPAFGLNTERNCISLYSVRIRENTDQKTQNKNTFHAVSLITRDIEVCQSHEITQ